jgi:acetyl esterase
MRNRGGPQAALQLLIYPCTDILSQRPSRRTYANGFFLDTESLAWFFEKYLPNQDDWQDWRASPLLPGVLTGFRRPPSSSQVAIR